MSDWKFQDLHLSHQNIYKQYIEEFKTNIDTAHKLIIPDDDTQPNYGNYAIHADALNETIDLANSVQEYWYVDVIERLQAYQNTFNQWVDNLKQNMVQWESGKLYYKNQFVYNDNISYLCINDTLADTGLSNIVYWIPFELQGEDGLNSFGIIWQGEWQANSRYNKNDCVFVETSLQEIEIYVANAAVTDLATSPTTNAQWTKVLTIQRNRLPYSETLPQTFDYPYDWVFFSGTPTRTQLYNVVNDTPVPLSVVTNMVNAYIDESQITSGGDGSVSVFDSIQNFYNYYNL